MGINGLTTTFKKINSKKSFPYNTGNTGIHKTSIQYIAKQHYQYYPDKPLFISVDFMEVSHHFLSRDDKHFLANFCRFMNIMLSNGAIPIFCFDGKPPQAKQSVINARRHKRSEHIKQLSNLEEQRRKLILINNFGYDNDEHDETECDKNECDETECYETECDKNNDGDSSHSEPVNIDYELLDELKELNRKITHAIYRSRSVTLYHCTLIQTILDIIGLEYFYISDIEGGEMICSHLQRLGHVKYCMTNDLDVFPMGATWVIREFNYRSGECQLYDRVTIMKNLGISKSREFIDMCILHGCDFIERPYGLTNDAILHAIKKHGTIDQIQFASMMNTLGEDLDNISLPENYDPTPAREFFSTPILDEVKSWIPPSFAHFQYFMDSKSSIYIKKKAVDALLQCYPELYDYSSTVCPLLHMLDCKSSYLQSDSIKDNDNNNGAFYSPSVKRIM